jgi:hypothetical protein
VSDEKATMEIERHFCDEVQAMSRARERLFSRVSHFGSLREGETYNVDLEGAWFKGLRNDEVVAFGPLQVVGLHKNGTFTWGWLDRSIPEMTYIETKCFVQYCDELKALAQLTNFKCSDKFAEELSQWIAVKMGWLGAYQAPHNDSILCMILKLTCEENGSYEPDRNIW